MSVSSVLSFQPRRTMLISDLVRWDNQGHLNVLTVEKSMVNSNRCKLTRAGSHANNNSLQIDEQNGINLLYLVPQTAYTL